MSEIWLIRHGPTHAKTMIGWTDLPADLSDRAAIAALERALPDAPVISSDLLRARATADAIQGSRPRLPHDPGLREMHFGAWEDHSWAQADAANPDLARALFETPGATAPPGGESWNTLSARVCASIDRLAAQHPRIIIVAHFGAILAALAQCAGWTAHQAYGHRIEPLSLSQAIWRQQVICVNDLRVNLLETKISQS